VIGAAHAGWRGLSAGVLENTVKAMRLLENGSVDSHILAWIGPAIGPQAFEVGQDVVEAFTDAGVIYPQEAFSPITHQPGKYLADIYLLARSRLEAVGVEFIYGGEFCTVTQANQFFSYRRDGITGRFASLIWIDGDQ
jgi:YfiH family protein